jgi:hypothetical protein
MNIVRFLIFLLCCGTLRAHLVLEAELTLEVHGDKVTGIAEADSSYVLSAYQALENPGARDLAWLRSLERKDWHAIEAELSRHWHDRLILEADGVSIPWTFKVEDMHRRAPTFLTEGAPGDPPDLFGTIEATLPPGTRKVEAAWNDPLAMVLMLTIGTGDEARMQPVLSSGRALIAERTSAEEPELKVAAAPSFGKWVLLGFEHILPKGVDHILFVLGLFLLVPKWKPLLQQTLVFTLAHSLSLAAASLGWVKIPSNPVEVTIAVSIAWVGIENLVVKSFHKWRLILVGVFGLIHGLGFAGVLADLLPADQPDKLPSALCGFNVGVELGQITVLLVAFACFGWLGERFKPVKFAGSVLVALAGLILVAERAAGIDIVPFL